MLGLTLGTLAAWLVGVGAGITSALMHDAAHHPFADAATAPTWIRPRPVRFTHTALEVTIDLDAQCVSGTVTHRCVSIGLTATLELDQHELSIQAVEVDGVAVTFSTAPGKLLLPWPGGDHDVRIQFSAERPQKGLYFVTPDPATKRVAMCWTQGAMEDHHYWFPCFDTPNNLGTYTISMRHRAEFLAAANGERASRTEHGDGWVTTVFAQKKPHVLYLLNVVVGDFVAVEDASASVPITHFLPRGHEAKAAAMFRATAFAIRWLGDFIGVPYPWARYGHVVVHRFLWGGMENTTLTTITDRVLMTAEDQTREDIDLDSLVIHELVHQWFGDLLTMKSWSDIWLNESFATYLEARGTAAWRAHLEGRPERAGEELALELWRNRAAYFEEDRSRYRRPLVTNRFDDAYELFDRVAYEKGSLILHHLATRLGETRFRAALALYTTRHAHDLVETADFRQALEDATGEPLDWWFSQWVERAGHPSLKVRWTHDPARHVLSVEVEQLGIDSDKSVMPWRLPMTIAWISGEQLERQTIELTRARETLVFPCINAPTWVVLDPDGELLTEWDEDADVAGLSARLAEARLSPRARARAAVALSAKHPTPALIAALASAAADAPELVRVEAIDALAALATPGAADALLTLWPTTTEPRLRRALAAALGKFRLVANASAIAARLIELGDADPSLLVAGECYASRGALEVPGATPLLRARLKKPSWNERLRAGCVRGLGASLEPAAIDEVAAILTDAGEHEPVRIAACGAAGKLGAFHPLARPRLRRALERLLDADLHLRSAAIRALAAMGDANARGALSAQLAREPFGNARRTLREALETLGKTAASDASHAALTKRVDDLDAARKALERKLEALEKRLG